MKKRDFYIDGTTVREFGPQPVRKPGKSKEELERIRRKKIRRNAARRNREKAMYMSRSNVVFLSFCVLMVSMAASGVVYFQSQMTHKVKEIAALESQINDLKADNDEQYKRVMGSVDLDHIKEVAINDLGMRYPTRDQIVYYTVDKTNFMDQYQDIPED